MSNPKNPLGGYTTYAPKHILIAFDNTKAASTFTIPKGGELGKCGDVVKPSCGSGIIVVNELEDTAYTIRDLTWSFDFFSLTSTSTTISAGNFTVADSRGNQFPSFLRRVAKRLGVAQTKITFYLVTVFIGQTVSGKTPPNERTAPLIFSLLDSATGFRAGMVNLFTFNFGMLYNTIGQMPNHSRLDQFTLTNKEKNPSNEIPTVDGGMAVIIPRGQEDAARNPKRDTRISKSAPMRTLKDIFEAFEADLQQLRFENKRQLQEFLAIVRPSIVKKIKEPKAKRVSADKSIPITFKVNLEKEYHNYPVDNLNLMTEQTETRQLSTGITSMTVPMGSTIIDTVDELMKLSTFTSDDVLAGKAFKTVISSVTDCDGVTTNTINIMQYIIPVNKVGEKDTGPDTKGTVEKLELIYLDGTSGLDVSSLSFSIAPTNDIVVLEEDSPDLNDDPLLISSQREQITFERPLNSGFSGLRIVSSPDNFGLQSAIKGVLVDRLNHRNFLPQNTVTVVDIVGNPDLYSDLARNPLLVANIDAGEPKLYKFPEYYPMYITLKVRIGKTNHSKIDNGEEEWWYHTYHYHLSGVTNHFVGGQFTQTLRLLNTDDAI